MQSVSEKFVRQTLSGLQSRVHLSDEGDAVATLDHIGAVSNLERFAELMSEGCLAGLRHRGGNGGSRCSGLCCSTTSRSILMDAERSGSVPTSRTLVSSRPGREGGGLQHLVDSNSRSISTTALVVADNSAARACVVNNNPTVSRMADNSYTASAVLKSGTPSQRPAFVARITAIVLITSGFARPHGASPVSTRTMFSA